MTDQPKPSAADQAYAAALRMRDYTGRTTTKPERADFDHVTERPSENQDSA